MNTKLLSAFLFFSVSALYCSSTAENLDINKEHIVKVKNLLQKDNFEMVFNSMSEADRQEIAQTLKNNFNDIDMSIIKKGRLRALCQSIFENRTDYLAGTDFSSIEERIEFFNGNLIQSKDKVRNLNASSVASSELAKLKNALEQSEIKLQQASASYKSALESEKRVNEFKARAEDDANKAAMIKIDLNEANISDDDKLAIEQNTASLLSNTELKNKQEQQLIGVYAITDANAVAVIAMLGNGDNIDELSDAYFLSKVYQGRYEAKVNEEKAKSEQAFSEAQAQKAKALEILRSLVVENKKFQDELNKVELSAK